MQKCLYANVTVNLGSKRMSANDDESLFREIMSSIAVGKGGSSYKVLVVITISNLASESTLHLSPPLLTEIYVLSLYCFSNFNL